MSLFSPRRLLVEVLTLLAACAAAGSLAAASGSLVLQGIEIHGNDRTSDRVVVHQLGLVPGQELDGEDLAAAIDGLRARGLFKSVDSHTEPGDERGAVVLVLDVVERGPEVRFGTGRTDLDGWYLIPVELSLDNALGRGETANVQFRLGYRHAGLVARYREGNAPADRWSWGVELASLSTDRVYFDGGVEYAQKVERGRAGVFVGRRLGGALRLEAGVRFERAEVDSNGQVWSDDETAGVRKGDAVPYADLPAGIADGVGERKRGVWHADLVLDTRRGRRAGTAASGFWGRLRAARTNERGGGGFGSAGADLRTYRPAPGGALALRLRADVVGESAPFYDRLYVGGLYTVRGVPSQSLSAPGGGTWSWSGSLEYRAALVGDVADPKLAGSLFVDVGRGGGPGQDVALRDAASGLGWGLRWRLLPGVRLGFDVAAPLDGSPVGEAFHGYAALGWTF